MSMQYGRNIGARQFYWWCSICEVSGLEDRLSFAMNAGRTHKEVHHAR
jgi:hypothetical protein